MLLKRKSSGKVKGQGCVDGHKQRENINKEEASVPTVWTKSVILTRVMDIFGNCDVATVDTFIQAKMDEQFHMKLKDKMT